MAAVGAGVVFGYGVAGFWLLDEIEFDCILDLGCGNARFLIAPGADPNLATGGLIAGLQAVLPLAGAQRGKAGSSMIDLLISKADSPAPI